MESNGKRVTADGVRLPFECGEINFGEPGTNGQVVMRWPLMIVTYADIVYSTRFINFYIKDVLYRRSSLASASLRIQFVYRMSLSPTTTN
jgi:glucose-6-phosphate isomerase